MVLVADLGAWAAFIGKGAQIGASAVSLLTGALVVWWLILVQRRLGRLPIIQNGRKKQRFQEPCSDCQLTTGRRAWLKGEKPFYLRPTRPIRI